MSKSLTGAGDSIALLVRSSSMATEDARDIAKGVPLSPSFRLFEGCTAGEGKAINVVEVSVAPFTVVGTVVTMAEAVPSNIWTLSSRGREEASIGDFFRFRKA